MCGERGAGALPGGFPGVGLSLIAAEEGEVRKRKGEADAAEKRGVCAGEDE
ncbi:hypothetical protein EI42_06313, partial [Thermosporothrix hazakensis]